MLYVLHGEEEFTRSEVVRDLKARMAEDGLGDLNVATLDGRSVGLDEVIAACDILPFLGNRRMVIVEGLMGRLGGRPRGRRRRAARADSGDAAVAASQSDDWDRLADYLPRLPPTTRLVLVETSALAAGHPLLKLAAEIPETFVREFHPLEGGELEAWVRRRAKDKGAEITPGAAHLLVTYAGSGLRALDGELEKLAAHSAYARPIDDGDVRDLVGPDLETSVFDLVDALGERDRPRAMALLERMLADRANELYLLTMIVRQVRLILGMKDLMLAGNATPAEIGRLLGVRHHFVIQKLEKQARLFEMDELEAILRRTLEVDQGIKTGRIAGRLALEMLAVEICHRRAPAEASPVQRAGARRR
jgi:DNA polymerase-3 subunit delta